MRRRVRTRSEEEGEEEGAGGAEDAAEVGGEEEQGNGEREEVFEHDAIGGDVGGGDEAGGAGGEAEEDGDERAAERLPGAGALLGPDAQRGRGQEDGPVAPVVGGRDQRAVPVPMRREEGSWSERGSWSECGGCEAGVGVAGKARHCCWCCWCWGEECGGGRRGRGHCFGSLAS